MSLTIRILKEICDKVSEKELDCPVVLIASSSDTFKNVVVFEEACAGVSEMITIHESPGHYDDARGENKHEPMRALLIAGHRFHDEEKHNIKKKAQQN